MLSKSKFRKKAQRIAISEIMISIILQFVLGLTILVLYAKISTFDIPFADDSGDESIEVKWILNLSLVMAYGMLDLFTAWFVYSGIKEKSYCKCQLWVGLQIGEMCLFTLAVLKRSSVVMGGFHFFEFIALCVAIYIYKIHHLTFVAGLLKELKALSSTVSGKLVNKKDKKSKRLASTEVVSRVTTI